MAKRGLGPIMKKPAPIMKKPTLVHESKAKIQVPKLKGISLSKSPGKARLEIAVKSFKKAGK